MYADKPLWSIPGESFTPPNRVHLAEATAGKEGTCGRTRHQADGGCGSAANLRGVTRSGTAPLETKVEFLDRKLGVHVAGYRNDWKNVQQLVEDPGCGYLFVANVGSSRSKKPVVEIKFRGAPMPPPVHWQRLLSRELILLGCEKDHYREQYL